MTQNSSTPNLEEFNPRIIPTQIKVIKDLRRNFDYSIGTHEIMLSGSVGSAKSVLMAHVVVTHCLMNKGARVLIGRDGMPDLRATIYAKILEHLEGVLVEKRDYRKHDTMCYIKFRNGSEIVGRSWADKRYSKVRSLELSGACIEELTENKTDDAYREIKMRVGRLPHIKENFIITATNPDAPSHWAYKYFIESDSPTRHTYYSVTTDNPFLPPQYIEQLKRDLDPKMARRMLYGEWIEIASEVLYYAYDKDQQYIKEDYVIDKNEPIYVNWDFNIGHGKPMSLCLFQYINDTFHVFDQVIVEGMRTQDSLDELQERGLLDIPTKYYICGDATGKSRDTRSKGSDYDIIKKFIANYKSPCGRYFDYEVRVPRSNPPIRKRHNLVNAYCLNEYGQRRLFVYKKAKTVDEGLRLTQLKSGGNYIEDDSKHFQHVTTALGYGMIAAVKHNRLKPQGTVIL